MTKIRLIAIDMDGTLLDSQKRLPKDFEQWVLNHPDIKVVAASGRQYYTLKDMFPLADEHLLYCAENGGLVFEHDINLFHDAMKKEDVLASLDMCSRFEGVTPMLNAVQSAYMCHGSALAEQQGHMYDHHLTFLKDLKDCPELNKVVKIALYFDRANAEEIYQQLTVPEHLRAVVSGKEWIDLNNRTVSKGSAIQAIQKKYNILPEESMAFGDYMNDYDMLKACGESYAMANACEEIKAVAKHQTASNDEDGVMKVLRTIS